MTVQELINKLGKIEDKSMIVAIDTYDGHIHTIKDVVELGSYVAITDMELTTKAKQEVTL